MCMCIDNMLLWSHMQLIEAAIALTRKVCTEDAMLHCHDFDWLVDAVVKVMSQQYVLTAY